MEIMWPVMLFMGLMWLRRVNPLYRQHECEEPTFSPKISGTFWSIENEITVINIHKCSVTHRKPTVFSIPQATSPTRPCPRLGYCHGSRESFVMPIILVFNILPVVNLLVWCPTTTTPCKYHQLREGGHFRPEVLTSHEALDLTWRIMLSLDYIQHFWKPSCVHITVRECDLL